jgi:hypothetical protein
VKRIFSVRINTDIIAASVGLLLTDAERSQWLQGFTYGLQGGAERQGMTDALHAGWKVGSEAHEGAREHQRRSGKGGRTSVERHPETRIDAQLQKQGDMEQATDQSTEQEADVRPQDHHGRTSTARIEGDDHQHTDVRPQNRRTSIGTSVACSVGDTEQSSNRVIEESNNRKNEESVRVLEVSDFDAWRYDISITSWARAIKSAGGKIGADSWRSWDGLIQRTSLELVLAALPEVNADERWSDKVEAQMNSPKRNQAEASVRNKYASREAK